MTTVSRSIFQDEILKLHSFVIDLANKVRENGELLLDFIQNKENVSEAFLKIKTKDKEVDRARWQVHDFGDQLIVLQQPVAKDFRQIITSIQVTDNLERIGDHFKKVARLLEKADLEKSEIPDELLRMANLSLEMLKKSISAYSQIFNGNTNEVALLDEEVDYSYREVIKKTINLIKHAPEEKIDSLTKLFFIGQSFERASDHAAKIGQLVNFAVTGKREKYI